MVAKTMAEESKALGQKLEEETAQRTEVTQVPAHHPPSSSACDAVWCGWCRTPKRPIPGWTASPAISSRPATTPVGHHS
jgi:hypothetical protein